MKRVIYSKVCEDCPSIELSFHIELRALDDWWLIERGNQKLIEQGLFQSIREISRILNSFYRFTNYFLGYVCTLLNNFWFQSWIGKTQKCINSFTAVVNFLSWLRYRFPHHPCDINRNLLSILAEVCANIGDYLFPNIQWLISKLSIRLPAFF